MSASSVCAEAGCPNPATRRGRCDVHAPRPYEGNRERREALGLAVPRHVRVAVRRAARNRCAYCRRYVQPGTGAVDHVKQGDPRSLLQLLCGECHDAKTKRELVAARRRTRDVAAEGPPPTTPSPPAGTLAAKKSRRPGVAADRPGLP